jgi:hypothetical protein
MLLTVNRGIQRNLYARKLYFLLKYEIRHLIIIQFF